MKLVKYHIAIFLLLLFVCSQSTIVVINSMIALHKIQVRKEKNKHNIYLHISQSKWAKIKKIKEDEIEIDGKMFDIKSIHFNIETVVLFGHFDTKEDELLAKAKHFNSSKNEIKKNSSSVILFFEKPLDFKFDSINFYSKNEYKLVDSSLVNLYLFQDYPPPKVT